MLECYFDGACEPINPGGNLAWGWAIIEDNDLKEQRSGFVVAKDGNSNNMAEYMALLALLVRLDEIAAHDQEIIIRGDSRLVINQMWGSWKMNGGHYMPYAQRVMQLLPKFEKLRGEWIPREENGIADSLTEGEIRSRGLSMMRDKRK